MKGSKLKHPAFARASAIVAICSAAFFSSCATAPASNDQIRLGGDMFGSRFLAMSILDQLRSREVLNQPIIVTTFVNLNNLNKSSVFGRALAEKLLTELHQAGFTVSEIRKGKDVFLREELGELILTRDAKETMGKTHARAVLAGTYVATADSVIINARLIDLQTPLILSSCSYTLKMTKEFEKLLTGESPF